MKRGEDYRGEGHHATKMSDAQIAEMKRLKAKGWFQRDIAAEFGVCYETVYRLTTGRGRVRTGRNA